MTHENTARKVERGAASETGLHLVHSRDWTPSRRAVAAAANARRETRIDRRPGHGRLRDSRSALRGVRLAAAIAVLGAPLLWIGHAWIGHASIGHASSGYASLLWKNLL